ncbi:MAG TPA: N-acetylmuramoyl-L-alanine amidase-like domain-containing protein [Mycobacterium sp.]
MTTTKNLNRWDSGGVHLPGLPAIARTVTFIPSDVSGEVVAGLRTGDYLGAYAENGGLDVTHVGIITEAPDGPVPRIVVLRTLV